MDEFNKLLFQAGIRDSVTEKKDTNGLTSFANATERELREIPEI